MIFATFTCRAEDMQKYMEETSALISMEEYEEALERTIWFHNNALSHEESMYGVRLSFALSEWHEFGKKYPPALKALKDIRDAKTNTLIKGKGNPELFHDVASINEELLETNKTITLFRILDKEQRILAKESWNYVKRTIFETKDYELIKKYIGNALREYSVAEEHFKLMTKQYKKNDYAFGERYKAFNENRFVEETLRLIELAIALSDKQSALEIKTKAKSIIKDYRLDDVNINKNAQQGN